MNGLLVAANKPKKFKTNLSLFYFFFLGVVFDDVEPAAVFAVLLELLLPDSFEVG